MTLEERLKQLFIHARDGAWIAPLVKIAMREIEERYTKKES